jgi:hypothetical protein
MGVISIGGMASSTLLTLLVVPVVYTLVDDAQQWAEGRLRALRARFGPRPTAALSPERESGIPRAAEHDGARGAVARSLPRGGAIASE